MKIKVQLRSAGVEEHEADNFEVRDNGALYVYKKWEPQEYGVDYTLDTVYARGYWECVVVL